MLIRLSTELIDRGYTEDSFHGILLNVIQSEINLYNEKMAALIGVGSVEFASKAKITNASRTCYFTEDALEIFEERLSKLSEVMVQYAPRKIEFVSLNGIYLFLEVI